MQNNKRTILLSMFLSISVLNTLSIADENSPTTQTGQIVGVQDNTLYIELDSEGVVSKDDPITILWDLDGTVIEAGHAVVSSYENELVTATLSDGQPSIGMQVTITSESNKNDNDLPEQVQNSSAITPTGKTDAEPDELDGELAKVSNKANNVTSAPPQNIINNDSTGTNVATIDRQAETEEHKLKVLPEIDVEEWGVQTLFHKTKAVTRFTRGFAYEKTKNKDGYRKALKLYRKAAKTGYVRAQFRLGWMLENGIGVESDSALALAWYLQAEAQGNVKAGLGIQRLVSLFE